MSLDPWPFSMPSLTLHLQTLLLAGPFRNEGEMETGFAKAKAATLEITLQPR